MELKVHNTFFTGRFLIHLPSVDSTNNFAKEHISNSSPIDGTVILADEQFAGRGQIGNTWQVEPNKNLTFSIIYNTSFLKASEQFYLNIAISLGIRVALNTVLDNNFEIAIKWPNDILVDRKKISGVLIENTISGNFLKNSIIGIGINVNQTIFSNAPNACSLAQLTGREVDRNTVFEKILMSIEKYFLRLRERKFEQLKAMYLENLFQYNISAKYQQQHLPFEGKIIDIEASGVLVIKSGNEIRKFNFKEVEFLW
ncbi:MAG: hypothetical protein RJA25_503 [Bacteroidota bacterium]